MATDRPPKYSAKHPAGTTSDPTLAAALRAKSKTDTISCADAFALVAGLQVDPAEVGIAADLLEYRIVGCQLGLFGYFPVKKVVEPANEVPETVRELLHTRASDGSISCAACWQLAEVLDWERMEVAAACEALGLKITPCQLGAF